MKSSKLDKKISRKEVISGKEIFVLDDVFSETDIKKCYHLLQSLPYALNDQDSEETAYSRHWKAEIEPKDALEILFWNELHILSSKLFPSKNFSLARVHSNLHLYGDMQFPHTDSDDGITVLYYANTVWKDNWMGETTFYSDQNEPLYAIAPKPGRITIFAGNIIHRAGVPSRECFEPRISLAFKYIKKRPPGLHPTAK